MRSPHTRGDEPDSRLYIAATVLVVPTRVGMNQMGADIPTLWQRSPHTRGDEPLDTDALTDVLP